MATVGIVNKEPLVLLQIKENGACVLWPYTIVYSPDQILGLDDEGH